MSRFTIRQRIVGSFAVVLVIMFAMGGVVHGYLQRIAAETRDVELDSLPSLYNAAEIMISIEEGQWLLQERIAETALGRRSDLDASLRANRERVDKAIASYEAVAAGDRERELLAAVRQARADYVLAQRQILENAAAGREQQAEAQAREQLNPELAKLRAAVEALMNFDKQEAAGEMRQFFVAVAAAEKGIVAGGAAALLLGVLCGYLLLRSISRPLRALGADLADSGARVRNSVNQVAATAKQQHATATEIAATTTEIGATSREISATAKELVKTVNEVAGVADQAASSADRGRAGLAQMEATMGRIVEAVAAINAKLGVLNEKAGNINQMVLTITKVADETNLLSLNAAIEAEKAGEHGRGFGVVATEIRRLADQTAIATYDIEQMVKEIQSALSAGVMGMDKFSEEVRQGLQEVHQVSGQLTDIIQQVQTLAPRVEAVNEGMQAQSTGAEQINEALSQLTEAAQQTVESLSQSNSSIDALNHVVGGLSRGVEHLKAIV